MERNGFHLPEDTHVCPKCKKDWMAEYDEDEGIECPYCKTVSSGKCLLRELRLL